MSSESGCTGIKPSERKTIEEKTLREVLEWVASDDPAPGGGSVAALSVAFASALVEMVSRLTIGRRKFADVEADMNRTLTGAMDVKGKSLALFDRDVEAFLDVMKAYALPKETEAQKSARCLAIGKALFGAARVPLDTLRNALEVMRQAETAALKGNPNAITDSTVAALLGEAALLGAAFNVKINLAGLKKLMSNAETAEALKRRGPGGADQTVADLASDQGPIDEAAIKAIQDELDTSLKEAKAIKERVLARLQEVIEG
ncbi:MAG TPA: cyclodeaminase/cyclohydrolase family protein [Clostridia bacterium]|nr:cyclodeaminase/cyclohydrolase family protein [Clostridia bacterium]